MLHSVTPSSPLGRHLVVAAIVALLSIVLMSSTLSSNAAAAVTDRGCMPDRTSGSSTPYQRICTHEGDTWSNGYRFYIRLQQRQNYNFSVNKWVTWQVIEQAWWDNAGYWTKSVCKITDIGGVSYC